MRLKARIWWSETAPYFNKDSDEGPVGDEYTVEWNAIGVTIHHDYNKKELLPWHTIASLEYTL